MIRTRQPKFETAPGPPVWLDPQKLGVSKLRFVDAQKVHVIEGGRRGVATFLRNLNETARLPLDSQAFVVVGRDGRYVFSREQFWLAGYGLLASNVRDVLQERVFGECFGPLEVIPDFGHILEAEPVATEQVIAQLFDIHEYATVEEISPRAKPAGAAVVIDRANALTRVAVPDTRSVRIGPLEASDLQVKIREAIGTVVESAAPDLKAALGPAFTDDEMIRRTPHMDPFPGPFRLGEKFNVSVYADEFAAREGEDAVPLEISTEAGKNDYEISVWLVGTSHFAISQPSMRTFVISRGVPQSPRVTFEVIVRDASCGEAPPRLTALFRYNERPCGQVSRKVPLTAAPKDDNNASPPLFRIDTDAEPPDMTVVITNPSNNLQNFECLVSTHLLDNYKSGVSEEWNLPDRTESLVSQHFQQFTAKDTAPEDRIAALRGSGKKLFDLAPKIFRQAYWRIRDENRPLKTIAIISQDPFIPWELMLPERRLSDGTFDTRSPLGVEFDIGRWISHDHLAPPQVVPLSDSWVFAPNYPGPIPQPLKTAEAEADLVVNDFHGARISPAVSKQFIDTIKKDCRSLLHFVCHGSSRQPGNQSITDENNKVLTSLQLAGYGIENACAKKKPFVFLNACEVGRPIPSLTGLGGFASEFVNLGASCVIAPLWSVKDDIAHMVAEEFYGAIKANPARPFADVVRKIREKAYEGGGEDTYAAYCFYGDPLAAQSH